MATELLSLLLWRSSRLQVALGSLFIGAGIVVLFLRDELDYLFFQGALGLTRRYALPVGLVSLLYGASFLMLQYLRGSLFGRGDRASPDGLSDSVSSAAEFALRDKLDSLSEVIANLKSAQLGALAGNREELIEALRPTVHAGLADELQRRFGEQAIRAERDAEIRNAFANAQQRLRIELGALSRRSNLNLVIGVLTTTMAVGLLTYMVLGSTVNFESATSLLSHYLPRLALVVFIEVFSFFFLRLYRATLAEMRTYQTDLTALTLQHVAVIAALSSSSPDGAAALSKELLAAKAQAPGEPKDAKPSEADPKVLAELLQGVAKTLLPKAKGG